MYSFRLGVGKQGYTLKSRGVLFKCSPPQDSGLEQYFKNLPQVILMCSQSWKPLFKSNQVQQNNVVVLGNLL